MAFGPLVGKYEAIFRDSKDAGFYYKEAGNKDGAFFIVNAAEVFCEISIGHEQHPRIALACETVDYPDKSLAHLAF